MATRLRDYYEVLGVPRTASQDDIKAAFRRLARQHHPDVNPGNPDAEARFKEISEAYEVLGDPEKRRRYDELGADPGRYRTGETPAGSGPSGTRVEYRTVSPEDLEDMFGSSSPFSDFFYDVFGGGSRGGGTGFGFSTRPRQGEDVEGEAEITLEEAYQGTTRTVQVEFERGIRRVEVRIPPGVRDGTRVRVQGQGVGGRDGGAAGDLYIRVRVLPHPVFRREGDDLHVRVPVPLDVAVLGGEAQTPTPRGTRVQVRVPPETQNGTRLRLRGLGMPRQGGRGSGDLYAEVDVRIPIPTPPELRRALEQVRTARGATVDGR